MTYVTKNEIEEILIVKISFILYFISHFLIFLPRGCDLDHVSRGDFMGKNVNFV